jgi:23S rRNA (cytosine1962-C5)-methyltransferase
MPTVWKLKKGMDRRFRAGHPWVYSNELSESPKGIEPGAAVLLQDPGGVPLALGYGNPKSLIAFRALTRGPLEGVDPFTSSFLATALSSALSVRVRGGMGSASFRLSFGEADSLPGLIIDRYLIGDSQAFVAQAHTAGADRLLEKLPEALQLLVAKIPGGVSWEKTAIVYRNDLGVRALEGIRSEFSADERVHRAVKGLDLSKALIEIAPALGDGPALKFRADLVTGQKTGFFLDQAYNIALAAQKFRALRADGRPLRILDLCCYVGQWSAQLARVFQSQKIAVEITAVDASQTALDLARENIEREGAQVTVMKADVLKDLGSLEARSFDLVICDPPALIKGRKDIPAGKHAYLQLNTQVFRLIQETGAVVSCSCSGLLEEEDFIAALSKAAYRNGVKVRWVARGSQSADHPMLLEFPEGRYLKSWLGWVG